MFKNKINLSIIIFLLLAILLVVFVIYPLFKEIKSNSEELVSQKKELATLEAKIDYLEKFKILYKNLEEILEKIENLFVNPEIPIEFISFLEKKAEDCQMTIQIAPSIYKEEIEKDHWAYLSLQISTVSSFPNFLKFLEKLESSIYLIEIQNLNINKSTKTELEGLPSIDNVQSDFFLKVFTK